MEQYIRLSEKFSYAALSFAHTLISMFVSTYILYYYTDVLLLPAASVSVLLLVVRLFDGAVDPFIGHFMDKRMFRRGKFKGYLAIWAPVFILFSVLLFTPLSLAKSAALLVAFCIYLFWSFTYSMVENVSGALAISLSSAAVQRRQLNTFRMVASILATLVVTYFALILVERFGRADEAKGFFFTALLFSAIALVTLIPAILTIRERNYRPTNRLSLRQCLAVLFKNKKLLLFLLMYLSNQIASTLKTQAAIYYFKYALDRMDMVPVFFLVGRLASLAAQPFIVLLSKRFKIIHLIIAGYVLAGVSMLCIGLTSASVWTLIAFSSIGSLFSAFPANLAFTYSAEIADEISQGSDGSFSGIVSSMTGLSSKIGSSVGSSAVALVLALSAYVPNAPAAQPALFSIQMAFIVFTAAMYFASGLFAFLSNYRKKAPVGSE